MTKKRISKFALTVLAVLAVVVAGAGGYRLYSAAKKILPYYSQLTRERVGTFVSRQPEKQIASDYAGSVKCLECHEEEYMAWRSSYHSKMIQSVTERPGAIVGDFSMFPEDVDFSRSDSLHDRREIFISNAMQ